MIEEIDPKINAQKEKVLRELKEHVMMVSQTIESLEKAETLNEVVEALNLSGYAEAIQRWQK